MGQFEKYFGGGGPKYSTFWAFSSDAFLDGGSRALFTGPVSTFFSKIFIKTGSHNTIDTFKNYFTTVFLVFSFQFLAISDIQIHSKCAKK